MIRSTLSEEQVLTGVLGVLEDALEVEDSYEIKRTESLVSDLGAESIDFLDITFRLERRFGIRINHGELFGAKRISSITQSLIPGQYDEHGNITPAGLLKLRDKFPSISRLDKAPKIDELTEVFTVQYLVDFVVRKLAE